jgi:hypothetical protein
MAFSDKGTEWKKLIVEQTVRLFFDKLHPHTFFPSKLPLQTQVSVLG